MRSAARARCRSSALALGAALAATLPGTPARAAAVLRPQALPSDEYTETFTFVGDLDDGTYVQLQLAVTNLGPGTGTGLCRALVKRPGAPAWTRSVRVSRREWRHEAGATGEALEIGSCAARSGDGTRVRVALAGRAMELAFPEAAAERAVAAHFREGRGEYRSVVLHAFTPVTARLEGFGDAGAVEGAGAGYADHSRTDVAPWHLARRWVRFRALRPPSQLLVLARERMGGGWDPAWIWRRGEAPRALGGVELRPGSAGGGAWSAALRDGAAACALASGERLHRHAPLEDLGGMGRLLGTVVALPVTYTYRARLEGASPADGILEISVLREE